MTHYSIVMNTDKGMRRTVRISNPNPNLPTQDIAAAVDKLLANDVYEPSRGTLDSLNRMELTTIQTTVVL